MGAPGGLAGGQPHLGGQFRSSSHHLLHSHHQHLLYRQQQQQQQQQQPGQQQAGGLTLDPQSTGGGAATAPVIGNGSGLGISSPLCAGANSQLISVCNGAQAMFSLVGDPHAGIRHYPGTPMLFPQMPPQQPQQQQLGLVETVGGGTMTYLSSPAMPLAPMTMHMPSGSTDNQQAPSGCPVAKPEAHLHVPGGAAAPLPTTRSSSSTSSAASCRNAPTTAGRGASSSSSISSSSSSASSSSSSSSSSTSSSSESSATRLATTGVDSAAGRVGGNSIGAAGTRAKPAKLRTAEQARSEAMTVYSASGASSASSSSRQNGTGASATGSGGSGGNAGRFSQSSSAAVCRASGTVSGGVVAEGKPLSQQRLVAGQQVGEASQKAAAVAVAGGTSVTAAGSPGTTNPLANASAMPTAVACSGGDLSARGRHVR